MVSIVFEEKKILIPPEISDFMISKIIDNKNYIRYITLSFLCAGFIIR